MKAKDLAERLQGRLEGDPEAEFRFPCLIEDPHPDGVAFLIDPRREQEGQVSVLVTRRPPEKVKARAVIYVEDPQEALIETLELFVQPDWSASPGIHPQALVDPNAQLDSGVSIGPFSVIEAEVSIGPKTHIASHVFIGRGARIGRQCRIYPHVFIAPGSIIGDRVTIYPGAIIGRMGFGFIQRDGQYIRIPHVGRVVIEDDCEIGANTCIDRASIGETRIRKGTKIDNLVQIAHNVTIGENTVIAGQSGMAGHVKIGNHVVIAGQVGIADHLEIGDGAILTAQAGITTDVPPGAVYSGHYARPRREFLKAQALFYKLPELFAIVQKLRERLENEERNNAPSTD